MSQNESTKVHEVVSEYYGKTIQKTTDLKTDACIVLNVVKKHHNEIKKKIYPKVIERYYGCGTPIPDPLDGTTILDLGSGTGLDCFVVSALAGKKGNVIGIDMTDEQLAIANEAIEYHKNQFPNASPIEFKKGYIEDLKACGIENESVDIVISNCVINLSPDKKKTFQEIFRVLKDGGEVFISDIFSSIELPKCAREDNMLVGECLGNALDLSNFIKLINEIGFNDLRVVESHIVHPPENVSEEIIPKNNTFFSITFSCFKNIQKNVHKNIEWKHEIVEYQGGIPGSEDVFKLDANHIFKINEKVPVLSNISSILHNPRFINFFSFTIDEKGQFEQPQNEPTFIETVFNEAYNTPTKNSCNCNSNSSSSSNYTSKLTSNQNSNCNCKDDDNQNETGNCICNHNNDDNCNNCC
ncbi:methyltransferase [Tritrichomonas foetus]|uniref:Arsenite methyltransferase n=1 Tax=Tritrichomonas foetus TaxID=1144522 RepID=A0A1J4JBJ7_9EUKA|nr:methyltransferase [Tritrichomonas foetus]OHS94621.1 methyltransferase [Tritrichomonas foetus]|eukprot:OHS94620.1 methyltransferase [Tritrichomonas foetus]